MQEARVCVHKQCRSRAGPVRACCMHNWQLVPNRDQSCRMKGSPCQHAGWAAARYERGSAGKGPTLRSP